MIPRILRWKIGFARTALFWERLWVALWPPLGIIGLFLVLSLLDMLAALPGGLHAIVLAGFAGALAFSLWRGLRPLRLPDCAAGERRLEEVNHLDHRPLDAVRDRLAAGASDPGTAALWRLHRRRMARRLFTLRIGLPSPGLPARDPLALRALVALGLVVGLVGAGSDIANRVARALVPNVAGAAETGSATLDVWITPPAYTRLAPLFLTPGDPAPLVAPRGSTLVAHVTGGDGQPILSIEGAETPFDKAAAGSYRLSTTLAAGERLAIVQGERELASWSLSLSDDAPPSVGFVDEPAATQRKHVQIDYEASDDYGLVAVAAVIRLAKRQDDERLEVELPLGGGQPPVARASSYHDLTAHPWAGLDVLVQLEARDAADHSGRSAEVPFVLPERIFRHPVAKAIIAARKKLSQNPKDRGPVVGDLDEISAAPQQFRDDVVVYLALRSARARLVYDGSEETIPAVQETLWFTALRVEDGELSLAERDLAAIREALNKALANRANDEEVQRLMDRLQRALERYLQALAQNLEPRDAETIPLSPNMRIIDSSDIQRMLDRIRGLARTGQMEAARQMLQRLERMIESLRAGRLARGQNQRAIQAQRMMKGLGDLIRRQQDLLDRTFRRDQALQAQPGSPTPPMATDALVQRALRQALGEIMMNIAEMTGKIPQSMGRAELAMRDAADALSGEQPGRAVQSQTEALENLRQGARALRRRLARQFGLMGTAEGQEEGEAGQFGRDPLGRDSRRGFFGTADGSDVRVPDERELQRAREILDELRRRAGELERPHLELDYLNRLLERF